MVDNILKKAKGEYQKTPVPDYLRYNGWADLLPKLGSRGTNLWGLLLGRGLVFASVALVILGSVVGVAQAAKPGDSLYPVKVLADNVFAKVTGNYQAKIERRADEVIDVSRGEAPSGIEEAKTEYQKTLEEAKNKAVGSGRQKDLRQTLDKQEAKFKQEVEKNPKGNAQLEGVIKQTEKVKDEIEKGNPARDMKLP